MKLRRRVIFASLIAAGVCGPAWGGEFLRAVTPPTGSSPSLARFYSGPITSVGEFPGTLVRLSCDSNEGGNPKAESKQQQDGYALMVDGDDAIHPLLPGTDEVRSQLNSVDLQGRNAIVYGKYYPSTGVIFAGRIGVRNSGAVQGGVASNLRRLNTVGDAHLAVCASN